MTARIIVGHVLDRLAELSDASVHCVITSPPYLGLRDYKLPPIVWGGDPTCAHVWGDDIPGDSRGGSGPTGKEAYAAGGKEVYARQVPRGNFCQRCPAWRGSFGLEPTPELYIEHVVEIFREVRRVLRDDGVLWLNMGDAYASTPNGTPASVTAGKIPGQPWSRGCRKDDRTFRDKPMSTIGGAIKAKDLMEMPSAVVMALRADGWWLRSRMPWLKRNSMPESITDRPSVAIEYVFLLSKSARYFYDAVAVRREVKQSTVDRLAQNDGHPNWNGDRDRASTQSAQTLDITKMMRGGPEAALAMKASRNEREAQAWHQPEEGRREGNPGLEDVQRGAGRSFRNTDLFFMSLEEPWGLISDADGEPLALDVCPQGFADAHFATFPPKLLEPLILAGTSQRGCCGTCGAPWVRQVRKRLAPTEKAAQTFIVDGRDMAADENDQGANRQKDGHKPGWVNETYTLGWSPSCSCPDNVPVPATVLDPFMGAGTTCMVAESLGRDSIGIELSEPYADMARARIRADLGRVKSDLPEKAADMPLFRDMT